MVCAASSADEVALIAPLAKALDRSKKELGGGEFIAYVGFVFINEVSVFHSDSNELQEQAQHIRCSGTMSIHFTYSFRYINTLTHTHIPVTIPVTTQALPVAASSPTDPPVALRAGVTPQGRPMHARHADVDQKGP